MQKQLQEFKTVQPAYFQFLDNRADPEDIIAQVQRDIGNSIIFTLFNNKHGKDMAQPKPSSKHTHESICYLNVCTLNVKQKLLINS